MIQVCRSYCIYYFPAKLSNNLLSLQREKHRESVPCMSFKPDKILLIYSLDVFFAINNSNGARHFYYYYFLYASNFPSHSGPFFRLPMDILSWNVSKAVQKLAARVLSELKTMLIAFVGVVHYKCTTHYVTGLHECKTVRGAKRPTARA